MYSIRLFEDYENNPWFLNGGNLIIEDLLKPRNKYNIKFFSGNPWDPYENEGNDIQDDCFDDLSLDEHWFRSPYFVFSNIFSFCRIEYNLVADKDRNGEKKDVVLWSVCSEHEAIPFIKDIFKIKCSSTCPFVIEEEMESSLIIIKNKDILKENEKEYLEDMCFDRIGNKYYLMSAGDLKLRRTYNNELLSFTMKDCLVPFDNLTWINLKTKNNW